ncbi:long-chain-fatty-acid--CoA ligase [Granulosicoccaceae sp. 1_MG-2023]|nr:long-chain-fatty-acid--CoA ligase [Granulosicoccaceae sp. 1_MG-2023]
MAVNTMRADRQEPAAIAVQHLLEKAADCWPESPSVSFAGKTYSWRETRQRCRTIACALVQMGVSPGDRVAYLGFNSHWCFELFFAAPMAGAIVVPVNFRLSVRELIECIEDAAPTVLLVDEHHRQQAEAISAAFSDIRFIYAGSAATAPAGMAVYDVLARDVSFSRPLAPSGNDDILLLCYTGGTTGRSKGVMLTHINQFTNAMGGLASYDMRERETHLMTGPMFHTAAASRVFTASMTGTHTVIMSHFDVLELMKLVQRYRINTMQLVPTTLQMMFDHPALGDFDLSSLRLITYGAAPMPVALLERALKLLPGTSFAQSYGMTEASPVVTVLDARDHSLEPARLARLESVGRAVFHNQVRIVDDARRVLPAGQVGEVAVKGSNVMKGYWRAPELTRDVLQDGWYYTGDSGYLDEDGYLFLAGRIKDMIVSGGENVYPIEVENALSRHPGVAECAVIGVPHEKWGESVHAVIRLFEPGSHSEDEIIDYCRGQIAHYKCPTAVSFFEEPLPVSSVNKILKSKIKKMLFEKGG